MKSSHELMRRADEALEMAKLVSYGADKERLLRQAETLRRQAEERSFDPDRKA